MKNKVSCYRGNALVCIGQGTQLVPYLRWLRERPRRSQMAVVLAWKCQLGIQGMRWSYGQLLVCSQTCVHHTIETKLYPYAGQCSPDGRDEFSESLLPSRPVELITQSVCCILLFHSAADSVRWKLI